MRVSVPIVGAVVLRTGLDTGLRLLGLLDQIKSDFRLKGSRLTYCVSIHTAAAHTESHIRVAVYREKWFDSAKKESFFSMR
ncbi:hypothetical protein AA101099_1321 [Neoasaia chiangmaiensis NBRC 101099]|nr:hypothetical protein AA101099_1321 [Neoasaia chiangmaiensis NBRC 101099]